MPTGPLALYDNRLRDGVPVALSTSVGFDVLNLRDMREYTWWQPATLPSAVTVACGAQKAADYALVAGHNLGSSGCGVQIHGSNDNFATATILAQKDFPLWLDFVGDPTTAQARFAAAGGTCTRAGTATRINAQGLVEVVAANTLRIDYDPVTCVSKGLLVESVSTNKFVRSAELDNAAWNKDGGITVAANVAIAPDGTQTADRISRGAGVLGSWSQFNQAIVDNPNGKVYGWSIWLKTETGANLNLNLTISDVNTTSYVQGVVVTPQWKRFTFVATGPFSNAGGGFIGGGLSLLNVGESVLAWGAQFENQLFVTSYIPTTNVAVARSADDVKATGLAWLLGGGEGSLITEATIGNTGAANLGYATAVAALSDGSGAGNESVVHRVETTPNGGRAALRVTDNGADQAFFGLGAAHAPGDTFRQASRILANNFGQSQNGSAVTTDVAGTMPSPDRIVLGGDAYGNYLNGWLRQFGFYQTTLDDATLQARSVLGYTPDTSDDPLLFVFASQSFYQWRARFYGSRLPSVAVLSIGVRLEFPVGGMEQPFDPIGNMAQAQSNRSVTGRMLGTVINWREWAQTLLFTQVSWAWVRTVWQAAAKAWLDSEPWYFAWNPDAYPKEVYQVGIDNTQGWSTPHRSGSVCDLSVPVIGRIP